MTVTTVTKGYLESPYLENDYLKDNAQAFMGMQTRFVIDDNKALGMQNRFVINDNKPIGVQARFNIVDYIKPLGIQARFIIEDNKPIGIQTRFQILDYKKPLGMQFQGDLDSGSGLGIQTRFTIDDAKGLGMQANFEILDYKKGLGMQYRGTIITSDAIGLELRSDKYPCKELADSGYLLQDYLTGPYLTGAWGCIPGLQARFEVQDVKDGLGMQSRFLIEDYEKGLGMQSRLHIVDYKKPLGMQFSAQTVGDIGLQFLATLYNSTNIRFLCEFPSRGLSSGNWTASSTEPGDFGIENVDTDVVEEIWRSATGTITGINLTTDTGLPQGVFVDTFAMLNHNLTRSATVFLLGSNDPTFSTVGITIPIPMLENNVSWVSDELPLDGYRYWRITIDDSTNTDGFISIGCILMGSSQVFQGECFVDQVDFEIQDFASKVPTEGFTNVSNSRTQKRKVRLDFRSLQFDGQNFSYLRDLFETARTTHKCLWIPTPDPVDPNVSDRFMVFGKLTKIPTERHNYKGDDADYVTFTIEVDESL